MPNKPSPVLLFVALVLAGFAWFGDGVPVPRQADLPIDAPGFHCVFLRERGQVISKGHAAVFGSQEVEDAASADGGKYHVFWADQPAESIPEIYHGVVEAMRGKELPQWCLCDSTTGRSLIASPPSTHDAVEFAVAGIQQTRGVKWSKP